MRSPITKLAAAAVVIIACLIGLSLWRGTESGIALADVLARIEQVKAYRFKSSNKLTGEDPNKPYIEAHSTSLWSEEYGIKTNWEQTDPNSGESTFEESYILPAKKTFIRIAPKRKKYWRTEFDDSWANQWQDNPRTMTKLMLEYKYESLGRSTIDGTEVEGFRTTDPNYGLPNGFGAIKILQADQKMWVDVKTRLPVRFDFTYVGFDQMGNKKQYWQLVMHDFQWDVVVDAAEFEPVIPDDYKIVDIFPDLANEETAIQGLKQCVELLGNYPERIDLSYLWSGFEKSETPAALRLKEELKGLTGFDRDQKKMDALKPMRFLVKFYLGLNSNDSTYYGKTVTPQGADKVLLRWKVSDNEYRVIYGDLHAETVTTEKLTELEKALQK